MFTLKGKQDNFRLILPDDFLVDEITEKYTNVLRDSHSFIYKPIDFLNETIQSIQVLGITDATYSQQQTRHGIPLSDKSRRIAQNDFQHTATDYHYRSEVNPEALVDKTLNIQFRHTLGFVNYFMILENFYWQYSRDQQALKLPEHFTIEILNQNGSTYSKIVLDNPIINGIDMLDLNYTQPVAQSQTFKVEFKFSNFDYQFINIDKDQNSEF